jgi:anaerobic selenocysteine-containing dehydrogenase
LITDTALWSENWPGIPRPVRGEIRAKFTNCSLCNAGCAVRARCVGDQPVALAGVGGGLCPFGLTAHHLPYHPARLKQAPVQEAAAAVADAIRKRGPEERVAVLDLRPGRTASWTYRRAMAAMKNGLYLAPPEPSVAVSLDRAKTVLSLGAPLLDGWGTPANVFAARDGFRLIQAEAVESRTASLADLWLPIRPGTEEALARGIAGEMSPSEAAGITGLSADQIQSLAKELKENGPALVVDRQMSPAVVALDVTLGAWGRTIGPRREAPVPEAWKKAAPATELAAIPDGSIRVLLIDESVPGEYLPWETIEKKLVDANPVVVAFAWTGDGYARHAHYILPTPVYPEALDDIPPAIDSMSATFRIASPLLASPSGMTNPSEFIAGIATLTPASPSTLSEPRPSLSEPRPSGSGPLSNDPQHTLRERAGAIHKTGRGTLRTYADGKSVPIKDVKPDDFWKALNAGGRWIGDLENSGPAPKVAMRAAQPQLPVAPADELPLEVLATDWGSASMVSPLMSQVYQESNLRLAPNRIALHPIDAASCGVTDGGRALLQTRTTKREVEVTVDSSIRPGVVLVAAHSETAPSRAKVVRV